MSLSLYLFLLSCKKDTPDSLFTDMLLAYLRSYIDFLLINFSWYMHLLNTHYPYINVFVHRNVHATGLERGWGLEGRMPVRWSLTRTAARFLFFYHFLKKTGHLNPHSPHHLYFLPKLLWHVSKKSSNNINSINFAICDQKYITIILPSKESSGNYVIRKNEQGKLCGLRFFEKTIFPTFL